MNPVRGILEGCEASRTLAEVARPPAARFASHPQSDDDYQHTTVFVMCGGTAGATNIYFRPVWSVYQRHENAISSCNGELESKQDYYRLRTRSSNVRESGREMTSESLTPILFI